MKLLHTTPTNIYICVCVVRNLISTNHCMQGAIEHHSHFAGPRHDPDGDAKLRRYIQCLQLWI